MAKLRRLRAVSKSAQMLCRRIRLQRWIVTQRQAAEMAQVWEKDRAGARQVGWRIRLHESTGFGRSSLVLSRGYPRSIACKLDQRLLPHAWLIQS
jgi:hypothetical protein